MHYTRRVNKISILAIDYGDSRVGIAKSDDLGITAVGIETIHYKGNDKVLLRRLDELIKEFNVDTLVIGVPISLNGSENLRVEITRKFIHKLKCKYNAIKIEEIDERLTTVAAHKTMNELNINKKDKKNLVDTISATYILETYMNINNCRERRPHRSAKM